MKEKGTEVRARLYMELTNRGFDARLGHRYKLGKPVKGFQVIVYDILIMNGHGQPIMAFYIGLPKKRRLFKYKLAHIPFMEVPEKSSIPSVLIEFQEWYVKNMLSGDNPG